MEVAPSLCSWLPGHGSRLWEASCAGRAHGDIQEELRGRRGHNPTLQNWTPALPRVRTLGKVEVYTEHSAPPGQLNLALKSQFSEHRASREHIAARLPHRPPLALENPLPLRRCSLFRPFQQVSWLHGRRQAAKHQVCSWM